MEKLIKDGPQQHRGPSQGSYDRRCYPALVSFELAKVDRTQLIFSGPSPMTAPIRASRRLASSAGVSQSMQLNCRTSKCNLSISLFLQVRITGSSRPAAYPAS